MGTPAQGEVNEIMPPRMRTQSVGRPISESRGGGTGERVGRGGMGRGHREGNDERVEELNSQGNDQGLGANGGVEGMGFCPSHEMQKLEFELWNHAIVWAGHAAYTDRFHELARLVPHLVTPKSRMIEMYVCGLALQIRGTVAAMEPKTIQKAVQISGALTDEAMKNESIKKVKKRGNVGEPSKDRSRRDDNKRTRTVNAFSTTVNLVGRENMGTWSKLNRAQEPEGNHPNQVATNNGGQGRGNQGNQARGRAFMLGEKEARQDPIIMTGTFTLNDHFATTLFDSGADYSFVSTTFIPLLGLEPSDLGFRYEIEIDSGQLVEIDKVIKGCKIEIEGHVFDIDLIPFGHGSFDMIIGMDWLSNYKAKIIFHKKVVRIPLPDGKVLRVVGERPKEKARLLMSAKASDKRQEEIVVEIKFRIELIPGATPVAKAPYRLTPSKMEELSGQLKELEDKELNKLTVKNRYLLPRIDDLFDQLQERVCELPKKKCSSFLACARNGIGIHVDISKIEAVMEVGRIGILDWGYVVCNAECSSFSQWTGRLLVYCDAIRDRTRLCVNAKRLK
ncbi:putative reverse transcriptase domain-containing protein [Tanacetum coccineum]